MNILNYLLSLFFLFSINQVHAQFSIFNTENPDIPYLFSSNSDGTDYANGRGIVGDKYYYVSAIGLNGYSENIYDIGAYSGNFKVASGQVYQRLAVAFFEGQTLRLERIMMDGTVDDFLTYEFPASSSVTLTDMVSYNEIQAVGAFYISGLETLANGDKVLFTLKYDEDLDFKWRMDVPVDASVTEVYSIDQLFQNIFYGVVLTYVEPTDLSVQVLRINQEGEIAWETNILENSPTATPVVSRFYGHYDKVYVYGNHLTSDGISTDYFAKIFDAESGEAILDRTTTFTPGSTAEESALQVQVVQPLIGPFSNGVYVEAGLSFLSNPNGQLYITQRTPDGQIKWYKEYDYYPELQYISQNGYICGKMNNQGWYGYFHPFFGDLEKRNESCSNSVNLAANACVTMSSEALGGAAFQVIDGLTHSNAATNFAATTVEEYRPYIQLDLGQIYWIDSIKVYPSNNPEYVLENAVIYGDLNELPTDVTRANMTAEFEDGFYPSPVTEPTVLAAFSGATLGNFPARYFGIYKSGFGTLEIEEIEIYGCEIADCEDNDGDGVCLFEDCNDFDALVPALPGTPCDDGNPLTDNDQIQQDHCTCLGGSPDIDYDNDGVPSSEDCNDYGEVNCSHFLRYRPSYNHGALDPNTCECFTETQPSGCNLNYQVNGSTLTFYGIKDDGQTGLNLFDANWNVLFSCDANNCNEPVLVFPNLPDGDYHFSVQIWSFTDCEISGTINIDQNACADFDGDGICNIDDPAPNNANLPTTPGTPCNDCNTNTTNDVIQADGFTCSGTLIACPDVDADGVCEDEDCDDNDPNIPAQPGTICDDGDPNTENDVILGDGCTCMGELPCPDADEDGVCADEDCNDNNPDLPTAEGTPCDDNDLSTINDMIQADGCTCLGNPVIATNSDTINYFGGNGSPSPNTPSNQHPTSKFNSLKLLPNPVNNYLTVLFHAEIEQLEEVIIYNNHGHALLKFSQETVVGRNALQVDVSSLKNGVYFVKLKNAAAVERLIKVGGYR